MDEATGKKWCGISLSKNGMIELICEFMHIMNKGYPKESAAGSGR